VAGRLRRRREGGRRYRRGGGPDRCRRGAVSPGIKKLDALRRKLAENGRDADAAVLRQVRTVGLRQYKGVKITREETK
jgi:hypothetical protein